MIRLRVQGPGRITCDKLNLPRKETTCAVCAEAHRTNDCPARNNEKDNDNGNTVTIVKTCVRWGAQGVAAWHHNCPHSVTAQPSNNPPSAKQQLQTNNFENNKSILCGIILNECKSFPLRSVGYKRIVDPSVVFEATKVSSCPVTSLKAPYDVMEGGRSQSTSLLAVVVVASIISLNKISVVGVSSIPDVNFVYEMTKFPSYTSAFCVTGDDKLKLTGSGIGDYNNPAVEESPEKNKIDFPMDDNVRFFRRGLVCADEAGNSVTVPVMRGLSTYTPQRIAVTVSQEQELRLRYETNTDKDRVHWQKEPIQRSGNWYKANVTENKTLKIAYSHLKGSGLYSLTAETNPLVEQTLGTFSVIVRECPERRYGRKCSEWCPDCMYGGECSAGKGECVCSPGLSGDRCQTKCKENKIGKKCNINLDGKGKQICLPAPFGCQCAPGYTGPKCQSECPEGFWGAGCLQTCSHCKRGCTPVAGLCNEDEQAECVGGDLGLPRLRKPPNITAIKHDRATVTFEPWDKDYDDGELPEGASVKSYIVVYWVQGEQENASNVSSSNGEIQLLELIGKTNYTLKVLVQVADGERTCYEDGGKRGRVHAEDFTTICPDAPPEVKGVQTTLKNSTSLTIEWEVVPYLTRCDLVYIFEFFNLESTEKKDLQTGTYTVDQLTPFTNYTFQVSTKNHITGRVTTSGPFQTRTNPTAPDPPSLSINQIDPDSVRLSWSSAAKGSVFYEYSYKKNPVLCEGDSAFVDGNTTDLSVTIPVCPYCKVVLKVMAGNEGGKSDYEFKDFQTEAARPWTQLETIQCSSDKCWASLGSDTCRTYNGPEMAIEYTFIPVDSERQTCHLKTFNESQTSRRLPSGTDLDLNTLEKNLLRHTKYRVTALAANREGTAAEHLGRSTTMETKPAAPLRVRNLRVNGAQNSLTLIWEKPKDCPPKGKISEYELSWKTAGASSWSKPAKTTYTQYVIDDLVTDTEYEVKVAARNEGVDELGLSVKRGAKTEEGKPSVPRNMTITHATTTEIAVTWQEPEFASGKVAGYEVGIHEVEIHEVTGGVSGRAENLTAADRAYAFESLTPGRHYNISVKVCNSILCSDSVWTLNWTVPEAPEVQGQVAWISSQPSTTTISLPYISSRDVINKQYVVVRKDEGDTTKWGDKNYLISLAKRLEDDKRLHRSDVIEWICAVLEHDEVARASDVKFTIGDNKTRHGIHNLPLERDKCYLVAVISVAAAGPHESYHVSDTKSLCKGPKPALVAFGVIIGFVILAVLIVLTVMRYRKRQGIPIVQHNNGLISRSEETNPSLVHRETTEFTASREPTLEGQRESHVYENCSRRITQEHIEAYLARAINSQDIDFEFKSVPISMQKSCSHGEQMENRRKNRYRNNLPYDDTRIRLPSLPDQPCSDYINASLITGHVEGTDYIATQGPKDDKNDTVPDFWRMVWHCRSNTIVMVANLFENGQVKVAQYWPENQPIFCSGLQITLVETEVKVEYVIRRMILTYQNEVRKVTQYQYIAWPDHGIPHNPFGLALMVSAIREQKKEGPAIVHCSAGIGRTGTILFVLLALDQIQTSSYFDGLEVLLQLRNGRPRLIENTIQYNFAHRILQEYLFGINTSFACGDFPKELSWLREAEVESGASALEMQYKKLKNLPKVLSFIMAKNPACANRNRNPDILPADNRMVFVQSLGGGLENQYINAVMLNALDRKDAYIAAEHPQLHTMQSMWALVHERRIPVWVLLQSFPEDDQEFPSVIPAVERQQVGLFELTLTGLQSYQNFVEYYVEISLQGSPTVSPHMCVLVVMNGWPHDQDLPSSVDPLLAVLERLESLNDPMTSALVTCRDGVTATGVMMALLVLIERIKLFQEVDVYRSVQEVIYARPQFITSVDQYDLLYEAAATYLEAYNTYGNFN
ncbi:receptor-type tyrosine-protein phosphatase mu-like [Penaeus indicus]|uniref:receptor-type tyrosine-protein phosphatase mu-like n=1 Tax=Penaeus indicus TaxID=29960 RepID=UPI00300D8252